MKELLESTSPIAIWGATLSTLLAAIKLWELWKTRIRIDVDYNFSDDENTGNDIIIRNLSGTPLLITYWELLWRQRTLTGWKQSHSIDPEDSNEDIKVGAYSSIKLSFREQDHFDWGMSALKGRAIFLRLHLAGRSKPILRKVYG